MDIQRWLNDTGGQNATIDEHLAGTSRRTEPIKVLPSQRKRRREASDTSLLESEPGNAISAKRRRERSATTSSGSSTAMSSHSSDSEALSERYEKRLRHKTRDGLYEPNSGVRREQSKRRKSKNKKGKSKHRKTKKKFYRRELAGRSLVDNFNARNVRRFRLTVRTLREIIDSGWVFTNISLLGRSSSILPLLLVFSKRAKRRTQYKEPTDVSSESIKSTCFG